MSDYDTGTYDDARRFSWWRAQGLYGFACRLPLLLRFSLRESRICLALSLRALTCFRQHAVLTHPRHALRYRRSVVREY